MSANQLDNGSVRNASIGKPLDRIDGRHKVTGSARYSAETRINNTTYAVIIQSTIAKGRITSIDTRAAEGVLGVIAIITRRNAPILPGANEQASAALAFPLLQDDQISFYGQHIGVVVAETLEQAQYAATLVRVTYSEERSKTVLEANLSTAYVPRRVNTGISADLVRGDLQRAMGEANVQIDATYMTPVEHHNPMEMSATIAIWEGARLTLYDSTQNVCGVRRSIATALNLLEEDIRVVSKFVGGGFGCKDPVNGLHGHIALAAIAARYVGRPVKLVLTRPQMFTGVGYRSHTIQRIRLGAKGDGQLIAASHHTTTQTSTFREFIENAGVATLRMYACPNLLVSHRGVRLDVPTPTIMRGPGEASGMYALESAMDELAYALRMDPIDLRIRNEPSRDPQSGLPWSSRSLIECFRQGSTHFGWKRRPVEPRSMRDGPNGRYLIGMGTAAAIRVVNRRASSARARVLPDGSVLVQLAATDLGTGTYTVLTQIAADALGIEVNRVRVEIGDTKLPETPGSAGSWGAISFGSAVQAVCSALRVRGLPQGIEVEAEWRPSEVENYSMHAFGAQFAEVRVDTDTGEVRVSRFLGVFGAGRILNAKTAHSQIIGSIVMGIGMALHEETVTDARYGNFVNHSLGEYHVPVNADIPDIDAFFVEEHDSHVNPLGVKGIGEIGIVGVAAAVANAVYHATGKRIRDLPITPDKLL